MRCTARRALVLLLALAGAPALAGDDDSCFAVDAQGNLYRVRCQRAEVEPLGRVEVQGQNPVLVDLAATPDGYLYGLADDGRLYMIDQEDPRRSVMVGNTGLGSPYGMVAVGERLLVNTRAGEVCWVDRRTGKATRVGPMGGGWAASGDIAVLGEKLYASVKDAARREHLVTLDPTTGAWWAPSPTRPASRSRTCSGWWSRRASSTASPRAATWCASILPPAAARCSCAPASASTGPRTRCGFER